MNDNSNSLLLLAFTGGFEPPAFRFVVGKYLTTMMNAELTHYLGRDPPLYPSRSSCIGL